uniref:Uncharacterized protein n=1 Tax=Steinernema glaseri TaxID=37863 RepID=A0A1I7ZAM3_9BILA
MYCLRDSALQLIANGATDNNNRSELRPYTKNIPAVYGEFARDVAVSGDGCVCTAHFMLCSVRQEVDSLISYHETLCVNVNNNFLAVITPVMSIYWFLFNF